MISLKALILEQSDIEHQYYDVGKEFAKFKQSLADSTAQLKEKFQQEISARLCGKRVMAKASRGYHQFQRQYEFDIAKITVEDYYDRGEYVVIAHDSNTSKPKEYFLDTKSQIRILSASTGQPSPQKGVDPKTVAKPEEPLKPTPTPNPQPNPANA